MTDRTQLWATSNKRVHFINLGAELSGMPSGLFVLSLDNNRDYVARRDQTGTQQALKMEGKKLLRFFRQQAYSKMSLRANVRFFIVSQHWFRISIHLYSREIHQFLATASKLVVEWVRLRRNFVDISTLIVLKSNSFYSSSCRPSHCNFPFFSLTVQLCFVHSFSLFVLYPNRSWHCFGLTILLCWLSFSAFNSIVLFPFLFLTTTICF